MPRKSPLLLALISAMAVSAVAFADPQSAATPEPAAEEPAKQPPVSLVEGAGTGGKVGYGRKGVLELGGSAGLTVATNMRDVNFSPSIGWFIANGLEMSAIVGVSHIRTETESSTLITALAEPSYHLPFAPNVFGFLGLGVGGSYVGGLGGGLAVAPRIGANFLVGRSGVLTPSLSWQYTTHSIDANGSDAMLAVSSALRINVGYTVMW